MASIGHVAVGMAAARIHRGRRSGSGPILVAMVFWSALSLLPDLDVVGFRFGIRYGDPWGHRGASHSFAFAIAVAIVVGGLAPLFRGSATRTALVAAVVVASHGVLDTFTDGGLGCALFWPFDDGRYFAPWNPIPVSPIGGRYFSRAGLEVALTELFLFAPAFLYALWPRRGVESESSAG